MIKGRLIIIVTMLLISSFSFADEVQVPFSCWSKQLQIEFKENGLKLDLKTDERTNDSWGYLVNEGSSYKIFTYRSITPEQFEIIKKITMKVETSHG